MEIDAKQACQVYLITHSQAKLSKFPKRKSFGNATAIAFNSSSKVKPIHWACYMESHEGGESFHYHIPLALSGPKRWLQVKRSLPKNFGVVVYFAENEGGYYSAYKYVCKHDNEMFHSESHPNLTEAGLWGTKKAMHGYTKRHSSQAQQKIENSNPTVTNENEPTTSKKNMLSSNTNRSISLLY